MQGIDATLPLNEAIEAFKRARVLQALTQAGGNQGVAAKSLGLQPSNLSRLMSALRYGKRVLSTPARRLSTLDTHRDVEREFKIGRRFAHAELLLLEDQVRLVVLVEANAHAEPHRPWQERIAPSLRTDRARVAA